MQPFLEGVAGANSCFIAELMCLTKCYHYCVVTTAHDVRQSIMQANKTYTPTKVVNRYDDR